MVYHYLNLKSPTSGYKIEVIAHNPTADSWY